jgi:hypothetical protein
MDFDYSRLVLPGTLAVLISILGGGLHHSASKGGGVPRPRIRAIHTLPPDRVSSAHAFSCKPLTVEERLHAFGDLGGYSHRYLGSGYLCWARSSAEDLS